MMSMFTGFPTLRMTADTTSAMDVGTPIPALAPWRAVRRAPALARRSGVS
jgi:hypothetical protein